MQKLAPLGSGGFVDGCGDFSFSVDVLMVKVAYYIDFALKASYFQNNEQNMLEMWNQNNVFES